MESVEKLQTYNSIKLFLAYANANAPVIELTDETKEAIAVICIKLDALPLALLLASSLVDRLGIDGLYNLIHESDIQTLEYSLADNARHRTSESDPYMVLDDFVGEVLEADKKLFESAFAFGNIDVSMFTEEEKEAIAAITPEQIVLKIIQTDDIQTLEYSLADNARHRTLEKLLATSYDLLLVQEQELFRRLGIFVTPCSIEAVINVCDLGDKPQIINLLSALKRHHLITFKDERIAISHNIIRSFARRRIKVNVKEDLRIWETLIGSFRKYYDELKIRYLILWKEKDPFENFANTKIWNWMSDIEQTHSAQIAIENFANIKGNSSGGVGKAAKIGR